MGRYLEFIKTYRLLHRNSQKRIIFPDACYFVTSNTFNWYPFFRESIFCDLFVENLRLCKRLKGFLLFGWVLVYDHFHLMVQPVDHFNVSEVIQFLKRHVSRNINIIINPKLANVTHEGDISQYRLRLDGGNYIQQFDRYVQKLKIQFHKKYPNGHKFPKFQWHESFNDHFIRNDHDFDCHMEYIKNNPIKHKMPDDWPYVYINPEYEDLIDDSFKI